VSRFDPEPIVDVLHHLLGPDGCPWDREQTPHSLCEYLVEEVYELVEAVRGGDKQEIRDEMGDVVFLLTFLATLLSREYDLDLQQVWEASAEKMRRRHPHVFGEQNIETRKELWQNWERIKASEKKTSSNPTRKNAEKMASIPESLPPLPKAYRIQAKAKDCGFTWDSDREQSLALQREWEEWEEVRPSSDHSRKEEEFGDLLFSLVEQGRREGIKANAALHRANQKFLHRFHRALEIAEERGLDWERLDMAEKDGLWEEAKSEEKARKLAFGDSAEEGFPRL